MNNINNLERRSKFLFLGQVSEDIRKVKQDCCNAKSNEDVDKVIKAIIHLFPKFTSKDLQDFNTNSLPFLIQFGSAQNQKELCLEFAKWIRNSNNDSISNAMLAMPYYAKAIQLSNAFNEPTDDIHSQATSLSKITNKYDRNLLAPKNIGMLLKNIEAFFLH